MVERSTEIVCYGFCVDDCGFIALDLSFGLRNFKAFTAGSYYFDFAVGSVKQLFVGFHAKAGKRVFLKLRVVFAATHFYKDALLCVEMNVKNLVLGIGIFVVYLLVLNYGIEAFYPSPQYENFCTNQGYYGYDISKPVGVGQVNCTITPTPQEQNTCIAAGGNLVPSTYDGNGCPLTYTCDMCNKQFNDSQKIHSQRVFLISIIAGIVTLLIGFAILTMEPVGSALMAAGVGAMVYGSMRNWQNLSNVWRFLLLLAALLLLIWIAIRINRASQTKGFWQKLGLKN